MVSNAASESDPEADSRGTATRAMPAPLAESVMFPSTICAAAPLANRMKIAQAFVITAISVFRRAFHVIDNERFDRPHRSLQPEPELLLDRCEDRRPVRIRGR